MLVCIVQKLVIFIFVSRIVSDISTGVFLSTVRKFSILRDTHNSRRQGQRKVEVPFC